MEYEVGMVYIGRENAGIVGLHWSAGTPVGGVAGQRMA